MALESDEHEKPAESDGWLSFHAYYHGDRDRLLRGALRPLLQELREDSALGGYFFIRYRLGGPHIRLRLLPVAEAGEDMRRRVGERFRSFFERHPSIESLDPEKIRQIDASILANDAEESARESIPEAPTNNSIREEAFEPEVERYGGRDLLPSSLLFFQVSSSAALRFAETASDLSTSQRLTASARLLIRQAAASSQDGESFASLVAYGERWWKEWLPLLAKADAAFERSPSVYRGLLSGTALAGTDQITDPGMLSLEKGAGGLAASLIEAPEKTKRRIFESQMHMTANRLGLGNADEVYLCRLLARAAASCREDDPGVWRRLESHLENREPAFGQLEDEARALLVEEL